MKNILILIGAILLAGIITIFALRFLTPEDDWLCRDSEWIRHGNPSVAQPTTPCK